MRTFPAMMAVAAALVALSPVAAAHMGEEAPPTGSLLVLPSKASDVPLLLVHGGDTLQWVWSTTGDAASVRAVIVWTDPSGGEHRDAATPLGQRFGTFVAPQDMVAAKLVFANDGASETPVEWTYQSSAEFWSSPDLILPAVIPFIVLVGAIVGGKLYDRHRKQAGPPKEARASAAPGRPSTPTTRFTQVNEP